MMFGNKERISHKKLKGSYFVDVDSRFTSACNGKNEWLAIYCECKDGKVIAFLEVEENRVTRKEHWLASAGDDDNINNIKKHFMIDA